jgi:hypothetical protein
MEDKENIQNQNQEINQIDNEMVLEEKKSNIESKVSSKRRLYPEIQVDPLCELAEDLLVHTDHSVHLIMQELDLGANK